jgi:mycothiol system anti-sigma-R factor
MSQSSHPNPFIDASGIKPNCMQMLQFMLDNEVTPEQKEYFMKHMDICMPCFKSYQLDMAIKELVKSTCCGGEAPTDLVDKIRNQIVQKLS